MKKYFTYLIALIISLTVISERYFSRSQQEIKNYRKKEIDLKDISKELKNLMTLIVEGMRPPNNSINKIRPNGYTYLTYFYNYPTNDEINLIQSNIIKSNIWKKVPTRTEDDKNIFQSYCYKNLGLNLSKYYYQDSFQGEKYPRLSINIRTYAKSIKFCESG